ncbi:MAG: hypothetical protein ACSHX7_14495, partial [Luteolibacter sp.]
SVSVILVLAGLTGWVGTQRKSIAELDREIATLQTGLENLETAPVAMASERKVSIPTKIFHADQPIDWKEVADYFNNPKRDPQWLKKLQAKLKSMKPQELIAELDKIYALSLPEPRLELMVVRPLIKKDPELSLRQLVGRLDGINGYLPHPLINAMREWAKLDVVNATAWFDEQAAVGAFDGKRPIDRSLVYDFHGAIIGTLISQDREAAALRFAMIPEQDRNYFLSANIPNWAEDVQDYPAFASIIREVNPEKDRIWPIAAFAEAIDYEKVGDYLDAIDATSAERAASAEKAAEMRIQKLSSEEKITRSDIDAIREWAGKIAPDAVGKVTGVALARSTGINTNHSFDEAANLALEYHAKSEDDDILIGFLSSSAGRDNLPATRIIAESITDPELREEFLRQLPVR